MSAKIKSSLKARAGFGGVGLPSKQIVPWGLGDRVRPKDFVLNIKNGLDPDKAFDAQTILSSAQMRQVLPKIRNVRA